MSAGHRWPCPHFYAGMAEYDPGRQCTCPPTPEVTIDDGPTPSTVWQEAQAERERAHAKHGDESMESWPIESLARLSILLEEVGEVAKEFNEAALRNIPVDLEALRTELIQVTAMAGAWADRIERTAL